MTVVELIDDVMRIVAALAFLYFAVRWSTSTKWWLWWDTRAMFGLFCVCAALMIWSVLQAAGLIPHSWQPWVNAITWTLIGGAGVLLCAAYEREQYRLRRSRRRHPTARH